MLTNTRGRLKYENRASTFRTLYDKTGEKVRFIFEKAFGWGINLWRVPADFFVWS